MNSETVVHHTFCRDILGTIHHCLLQYFYFVFLIKANHAVVEAVSKQHH